MRQVTVASNELGNGDIDAKIAEVQKEIEAT